MFIQFYVQNKAIDGQYGQPLVCLTQTNQSKRFSTTNAARKGVKRSKISVGRDDVVFGDTRKEKEQHLLIWFIHLQRLSSRDINMACCQSKKYVYEENSIGQSKPRGNHH